jgi:hypothetical protein
MDLGGCATPEVVELFHPRKLQFGEPWIRMPFLPVGYATSALSRGKPHNTRDWRRSRGSAFGRVALEAYQLAARCWCVSWRSRRPRLLIADDRRSSARRRSWVWRKLELLARQRIQRILIVAPARPPPVQWSEELFEKFGSSVHRHRERNGLGARGSPRLASGSESLGRCFPRVHHVRSTFIK